MRSILVAACLTSAFLAVVPAANADVPTVGTICTGLDAIPDPVAYIAILSPCGSASGAMVAACLEWQHGYCER